MYGIVTKCIAHIGNCIRFKITKNTHMRDFINPLPGGGLSHHRPGDGGAGGAWWGEGGGNDHTS